MNETVIERRAASCRTIRPWPRAAIGVLLVNLGTPDATDYWSMRRYLKEFLSDRRVIEENRVKWWLILNLIILTFRPGSKGRDYDKIWNRELQRVAAAAPSRARRPKSSQRDDRAAGPARGRLGDALRQSVDRLAAAMRCSNPAASAFWWCRFIRNTRRRRSATVADKAFDVLKTMRWQPAVRIAPPWHDDPVYIEAVAVLAGGGAEEARVQAGRRSSRRFTACPKDYLLEGRPLSLPVRTRPRGCCARGWA